MAAELERLLDDFLARYEEGELDDFDPFVASSRPIPTRTSRVKA